MITVQYSTDDEFQSFVKSLDNSNIIIDVIDYDQNLIVYDYLRNEDG